MVDPNKRCKTCKRKDTGIKMEPSWHLLMR